MDANKDNKAARIVVKGIVFILALVATFFISYFCVGKLYSDYLNKKDAQKAQEEEAAALLNAEENVASCGFTMVYLDNSQTEAIDYCLLRVFNELSCEMSIFQIPTDSQVTLSDELYETISEKAGMDINRTLFLSEVGTYFSEKETAYEMINLIIQELMGGVEVRSYEALDYDTFIQMVDLAEPVTMQLTQIVSYTDEYGDTKQLAPNNDYEVDGRMALGILTYTDGFGSGDSGRIDRTAAYLKEFVTSMTTTYTEEQMDAFLSSYYGELVKSTGSTDSETDYLDDILSLTEDNLSFYTLKGTQSETAYTLDAEKIQEDLKILMGEEAYAIATGTEVDDSDEGVSEESTTAAEEATTAAEEDVISSKDKTISIYNGAYINRLAGDWRDRLEEEGYTIGRIDDYDGETLDHGKIIVKEEGWGKDLQEEYFPEASIEVGTPEDGMDIQIILGRSEDF